MEQPQQLNNLRSGDVALRLLCHASKIVGLIGLSRSKLFPPETDAKIRIEVKVHVCEEQVVLIVAPGSPKETMTLKGEDGGGGEVERCEVSPAQEALIRVFERVLEVEARTEEVFPPPGGAVVCKLLGTRNQVGAVMGKGGSTIDGIRKGSGTRIQVLPPHMLPASASEGDQVIQILGEVLAVKKALVAISSCLQDNPPTEKDHLVRNRPFRTTLPETYPDTHRERQSSLQSHTHGNAFDYQSRMDYASTGRPVPVELSRISKIESNNQQEVSFRLLCSNDVVGGIIGKGGSIVKTLQESTGASISVGSPGITETDERVITISAAENPESRYSPAQDATVRVFSRSVEAGTGKGLGVASNNGTSVSARLLVASKEVGCLIGKGGAIMQEMRKSTGTCIRIIGGDKVTKGASDNDQVVQIVGELRSVQDAVFHVTGRLRNNLFSTKTLKTAGPRNYSSYTGPDMSPYRRLQEPTSTGLYPSSRLSHNKVGHNTLEQGMENLGISNHRDHPRSPRLWGTQTLSGTDAGRGLTSLRSGLDFGSGGKTAIVTNTTLEILVPEQVLGCLYGNNGNNLNKLREISGAKVVMHESRNGTNDAVFIISGTPDETQKAQSLLQAFIASG